MFVNDVPLENASLDTAVQALKGVPQGQVRIGVAKPLPVPEGCEGTVPADTTATESSDNTEVQSELSDMLTDPAEKDRRQALVLYK